MGNIQTTPGWLGYCGSHGYNRPILGQGLISSYIPTKENEEMGKGGIKLHQRVLQLSSLKEIIFPCSKISFLHLCNVPKIWSNFAVPTTQAFTAIQTYDQIQNGVCQKL